MRDKVLAVIEAYAAGGTLDRALETVGISKTPFRRILRTEHDVMALYEGAMRSRSYSFLDDAHQTAADLGTDQGLSPQDARVKADILMKLSGMSNPDRFGDRMNVQHEVKPSLVVAIQEARARTLRPPCDPALIIDAEYTAIPSTPTHEASDKQSEDALVASVPALPDPFEL